MIKRMIYIITGIIILIIALFIFTKKSTKRLSAIEEWNLKIKNAKLNKELYLKSNETEREDLFLYYIFKISDEHSINEMPKPLKVFYLIKILEMEVNNGGLLQFFTNSSGKYAKETIEALNSINAKNFSQILKQGIDVIIKYNENHKSLNSKLDQFKKYEIIQVGDIDYNENMSRELDKLDSDFFKYPDDITKLKWKYIDKNIDNEFWKKIKQKYGN